MVTQKEVFSYVRKKYRIKPDYPFKNFPRYGALRHPHNRRWFGMIMDLSADKLGIQSTEAIEVLNVKVIPEEMEFLLQETGIYPAYHLNKDHWVSINLNEVESLDKILAFIDTSFELTR